MNRQQTCFLLSAFGLWRASCDGLAMHFTIWQNAPAARFFKVYKSPDKLPPLRGNAIFDKLLAISRSIFQETLPGGNVMINKTARLFAVSAALLWSGVAVAQSGSPTGSPTGMPGGSGSGAAGGAPAAPSVEAVLPASGNGFESVETTTTTTTTDTDILPTTGGAPLLMALTGALSVGGALLGLKKMR